MSYYTGDHVVGEAHKPGYRARQHMPQNAVEEYPVAAGQSIVLGDIITLNAAHYATNFASGTTSGSYGVADLRNGLFQALNQANNTNGAAGDQMVTVTAAGAFAELYAAAGVGIGDFVEMDLTKDDGTALDAQLAATTASASRQRVKKLEIADLASVIGSATTQGTATLLNPEAYGFVGRVRKIMTRDDAGALKRTTSAGDVVSLILGGVYR